MKSVYCVYKPAGSTPLEMVRRLKAHIPELSSTRIGYAGRLDPMAEGLLILLTGEENKQKNRYETLPKTYVVEILFGFGTDTHDILGIVEKEDPPMRMEDIRVRLENSIQALPGFREQTYPAYSAKHVNGKPLFYWARKNLLGEIKMPKKTVQILKSTLLSLRTEHADDLSTSIIRRLQTIEGDFRQAAIQKRWKEVFAAKQEYPFTIATIEISCTSGTYMRSLAQDIGASLTLSALAWTIKRTQIGEYTSKDALILKPVSPTRT